MKLLETLHLYNEKIYCSPLQNLLHSKTGKGEKELPLKYNGTQEKSSQKYYFLMQAHNMSIRGFLICWNWDINCVRVGSKAPAFQSTIHKLQLLHSSLTKPYNLCPNFEVKHGKKWHSHFLLCTTPLSFVWCSVRACCLAEQTWKPLGCWIGIGKKHGFWKRNQEPVKKTGKKQPVQRNRTAILPGFLIHNIEINFTQQIRC